jgi:phosphoserine aminotransferase
MTLHRSHNFNAGPAVLPLEVLQQAQAEMLDYKGTGMSIMEMSHRSKEFEAMLTQTQADLRTLLNIPANYKILFLQGGATTQFAMIPMNLRANGTSADYVVNGAWGKAAAKEAQKFGTTKIAHSTESTKFDRASEPSELALDPNAAYLHFTLNETIHGNEWFTEPTPPANVPLVCDMSSNFLSRPIDVSKYALIYAGAQKNAGPSGVTVVIIRDDLLERTPANLPLMLDYKVQADNNSLYNTPPCFSIYIVGLVCQWLIKLGGLSAVEQHNITKANLVYSAIDQSGGFYRGHAQAKYRSRMNIPFFTPTPELDEQFAKEATKQGLIGLKGHRSVGGLRASTYNALPLESAQALSNFMAQFQRNNG